MNQKASIFKNISNILFYINYKIKEIKLYGESNCVDFFNSLEGQIRQKIKIMLIEILVLI